MTTGKYSFFERIGAGGMGEVYRARMTGAEGFQKIVAVKRLLSSLTSNKEIIQMFVDEARILSGLNHPNIVQVHDFEKIGSEYLLIMEYVHGRALSEILSRLKENRQELSPGLIGFIAAETAAGLAYAHNQTDESGHPLGIVHRDVSPQNILISTDGQVKITDFGIAQAASRTSRTQAGFIKGKFGYLSPEQTQGDAADRRVDIFTLGIVVFKMITGYGLFRKESDIEMLKAVENWKGLDEADRPERIPEGLWNILGRMLRPDPRDRYQETEELCQDLREVCLELSVKHGSRELAALMSRLFGEELTTSSGIRVDERSIDELISSEVDRFKSLIGKDGATPVGKPERPSVPTEPLYRAPGKPWWLRGAIWLVLLVIALGGAVVLLVWERDSGTVTADGGVVGRPAGGSPVEDGGREAAEPVKPDAGAIAAGDKKIQVRKRFGTLVLNSSPWAYVEINGKRHKKPTPIAGLRLPAGKYKIRLYNPVIEKSKVIQVRIQPGKTTRRVVRF